MRRFLTVILVFLSCAALPTYAQSEISIQDTAGFTRAVGDVGTSGRVDFTISDGSGSGPTGIEVKLTNSATGEVITAVSDQGAVVFENLSPGLWTVSTATPGVTFTAVTVAPATVGVLAGQALAVYGPAVLGVGAVAGGTVAIIESNDSGKTPISPAS